MKLSRVTSLRAKFSIMVAAIVMLVGLILGIYSYRSMRDVLNNELLERGQEGVSNLAFNSRYGVLIDDHVALRDLLGGVIRGESVLYGRIYNDQGQLILEAARDGVLYKALEKKALALPISSLTLRTSSESALYGGHTASIFIAPIFPRGTENPAPQPVFSPEGGGNREADKSVVLGYAEIALSHERMGQKLQRLVWFYLSLTLSVVVVGVLICEGFVWVILLPVKGMIRTAQEIVQGNMKRRVHVRYRDEIGELATIFNQMAESLSERDDTLRDKNKKLEISNADLKLMAIELQDYKQALEQKVKERTEELAQKNILLRGAMERAQSADLLKTQFMANMSHELRTPLNAIIGFAQVMIDGIDGDITATQREDLKAINKSGLHLLAIINDILDISRIEAGKMRLDIEEVGLSDIIVDVMATAKTLIKDHPVTLKLDVVGAPLRVCVDRSRIRQVILNLLGNAIKFTPKGSITLRVRERVDQVEISVIDTGIGIRPEDIPVLFTEFRQLDPSSTRSQGGAGLGLALSKRFVEMHGGRIWAESEKGSGATFSFFLPMGVKG